jgi:2'-5' RNA ligase
VTTDQQYREAGATAVVLLVPEAQRVVDECGTREQTSLEIGAHITLLYPFVRLPEIGDPTLNALRGIATNTPPIDITFAATGRFPGVLWLDPDSPRCDALIRAIRSQWPELPPYGRPDFLVVPHMTVLRSDDDETIERAETRLRSVLPLRAIADQVSIITFDGYNWTRARDFTLGGSAD